MANIWDQEVDVLVIGSGSAGLSAAIAARSKGANVCVFEKSDKFGGTTAMSGGVVWVPNNHHMEEIGSSDTRARALEYLSALSASRIDDVMIQTYVDRAPETIKFLEKETELRFRAVKLPDYHSHFGGGNWGRSITPNLISGSVLGDLRTKLRAAPHFPIPITLNDIEDSGAAPSLAGETSIIDPDELVARMRNDMLGSGAALVVGLLHAASKLGVSLEANTRVNRLILDEQRVKGVEVDTPSGVRRVGVKRGVIIASGGFERNPELVREFLRGPLDMPLGCPENEGDGLIMAMEVGAALANMTEAWWVPCVHIAGEEYEGRPLYRPTTLERAMPGAIIVNRRGRRFVNEAHNYNDITRAFHNFDPVEFAFSNHPAWLVFHHERLEKAPFLTRFPSDPVPNWLLTAPTLRALAAKMGVDADGLEQTVAEFNKFASDGYDPHFGRGETEYDRYYGDPGVKGPQTTLGPLDKPPFYAIEIHSGTIGTKGGAKTNEKSEVLNVRGKVIPGLYAAGNASASVMGMAYPGAGGTIGPALTFGYIAGLNAGTKF